MTRQWILTGVLGLFLLSTATRAMAAEFTYRGVKFGMTREEVSKHVPLIPGTIQAAGKPGTTAKAAYFQFDDKDQLYSIELNYLLPHPVQIMRPAMRRALQKKYAVSNPSEKVWDLGDALMSFEEYYMGSQGYLRITTTHKRL